MCCGVSLLIKPDPDLAGKFKCFSEREMFQWLFQGLKSWQSRLSGEWKAVRDAREAQPTHPYLLRCSAPAGCSGSPRLTSCQLPCGAGPPPSRHGQAISRNSVLRRTQVMCKANLSSSAWQGKWRSYYRLLSHTPLTICLLTPCLTA